MTRPYGGLNDAPLPAGSTHSTWNGGASAGIAMSPSVMTATARTVGSSASQSSAGDHVAAAVAGDLVAREIHRRQQLVVRDRGVALHEPDLVDGDAVAEVGDRAQRARDLVVIEPDVSSTTLRIQPSRRRPGSTMSSPMVGAAGATAA